jgi:hypothetical protein
LRYYLDFCQKYNFPPAQADSLPRFVRKLQEKKQTTVQQEQAACAIKLYYEIAAEDAFHLDHPPLLKEVAASYTQRKPVKAGPGPAPATVSGKPATGASWKTEYANLSNEIQVRHYSPKTLKTYLARVRKFQSFTHTVQSRTIKEAGSPLDLS